VDNSIDKVERCFESRKRLLGFSGCELWLFIALITSGAFSYSGSTWPHTARYYTIFSFVEPGTPDYLSFRIDHLLWSEDGHENTGDWAYNSRHDKHYYSNKAPGIALLGIPIYAVIYNIEQLIGVDPTNDNLTLFNCYLLNLFLTGLPVAFSGIFFFRPR